MSIRVEEQELSIMDDMLKALRQLGDYRARRRVLDYVHNRIEADETAAWEKRAGEKRQRFGVMNCDAPDVAPAAAERDGFLRDTVEAGVVAR